MTYRYSRGTAKTDSYPDQRTAPTFDNFADAVLRDRARIKGAQYVTGPFKPNGNGRSHRCKADALPRQFLPFDLDRITDSETWLAAVAWLQRYRGFAYTTASHTPAAPRARIVLDATREMSQEEGERVCLEIEEALASAVGGIAFDRSVYGYYQPLYCPPIGCEVYRFDGEPVDVDAVLASSSRPVKKQATNRITEVALRDPVARALSDKGMVLSSQSGALNITCPFAHEHTTPDGEKDTIYYLPHTGGYATGRVVCLHAHCRDRPQEDFLAALGVPVPWITPPMAITPAEEPASAISQSDSLPMAEIRNGETPRCADMAETALMASDAGIYQRGALCRVTRQKLPTVRGISRSDGLLTIVPIDKDYLLDLLDRHMDWRKYDQRTKKLTRRDAPIPVAKVILSRIGQWKFPILTGVISAPTLRPDGSILDRPGYDASSGLLFDPLGTDYPPIPVNPTHAQGKAALAYLKKTVFETPLSTPGVHPGFPFASPCAVSSALSAILTGLVRRSLPTAPLHLFTASRAGSGKTLLANVVSLIATGSLATRFAMPERQDEEEQEKRLLSIFAAGDLVINIDNVEGSIGGRALAEMLTTEIFTGRVLGQSKTATYPAQSLWLATGNNVVVKEDLTRRVVLCELTPQVEKPENLAFQHDLKNYIPQHRGALVISALTALRAYFSAGRPHVGVTPYGSFEEWSSTVRSALIWLGEADPLENVESMESSDPIRKKLRDLMVAWHMATKTIPETCAAIASKAGETEMDGIPRNKILRDCLMDHFGDEKTGKINTRRMGEFIQKHNQRIENGAKFEFGEKYGARVKWRLVIVDKERFEKASFKE